MLNTITALKNDIFSELEFLKKFKPQKMLSKRLQKKSVFCGSGDSLAASMLAESFSDYRVKALDPLDVIKNKKLLKDKKTYFVSVSGNTISNIKAARFAKNSTVITKNPSSRLAKICDNIIALDYSDSGILTAGSIGFLASALCCISLVSKFKIKNAEKLFCQAKKVATQIVPQKKVFVLGNQYTYPVAMYAAAKLYETLGYDAYYERIEQFLHMGLFSARTGDTVIILEQKNTHNTKLAKQLKKLHLHVYQPNTQGGKIEQIIFYILVSQLVALSSAQRKHLSDCYFVTNKKIRDASSSMIY